MDNVNPYSYLLRRTNSTTLKKIFNITISFVVLILASPCMLIIALLIYMTSKGSIFFYHTRVGLGGKEFVMYKFRTMKFDAEQLLCSFTKEQQAEFQSTFKLKNDPRVTPFGNILRKTSLDELPQFINVLKGDMSIVGPRPITREELAKYGKYTDMLLSVKPGITGLWQISGRNNVSYEDRIFLDIDYVQNCSFLMDVKIFLKTFKEVALRLGAY